MHRVALYREGDGFLGQRMRRVPIGNRQPTGEVGRERSGSQTFGHTFPEAAAFWRGGAGCAALGTI